jgi:hypothetical protein
MTGAPDILGQIEGVVPIFVEARAPIPSGGQQQALAS